MDRLTDLRRLLDIELAKETRDEAEIAKLTKKIEKTKADAAPGARPRPRPANQPKLARLASKT
jgi:transposase